MSILGRTKAGMQEAHCALSNPGSRCDFECRRHQVRFLLPLTHRGADQFVVTIGVGHRIAHDLKLLLTGGMIDHAAEGTQAGHEHQGQRFAGARGDLPPQVLQTCDGSHNRGHCVMLHRACNGGGPPTPGPADVQWGYITEDTVSFYIELATEGGLPPQVCRRAMGLHNGGHCVVLHRACDGLWHAALVAALVCFPYLSNDDLSFEARNCNRLKKHRRFKDGVNCCWRSLEQAIQE